MAKKKRVLCSEHINIYRFGSGFTFEASRWYEKEPHDEFKEIYTDRMKLIEGLAKYLGLETEWRPAGYLGGFTQDTFCVLKPKPEKVA